MQRPFMRLTGILAIWLIAGTAVGEPTAEIHNLNLVDRILFGPGLFPDQHLEKGHVKNMAFTAFMRAVVPAANNGAEPPNVSGEVLQGTPVDGKTSDGTLINENIDMGHAVIMNGGFDLLLAAVAGGPHGGDSFFALDDDFNWTIRDDIAIDPGFAEAIVKIDNFFFTTGPREVPFSLQTQLGHPGGVDRVGSLRSGDVVVGRVGDDDMDGFVDGIFMALGSFPFTSMILPGAPFVLSVEFKSDIPISPLDAALLTAASARNSARTYLNHKSKEATETESIGRLPEVVRGRLALVGRHLHRALANERDCHPRCRAARVLLSARDQAAAVDLKQSSVAAMQVFDQLFDQLHQIHAVRTDVSGERG